MEVMMWPLLSGLVSGGASLLGSIFSSNQSAKNTQAQLQAQEYMQAQSQEFNAQQAELNRNWQAQMSNTAFQRASNDMKTAGLNPAMMFGSAGAASTPGGATASSGTPTVPLSQNRGALAGLGEAVERGLNASISAKTIEKMTDEIANLKALRGKTEAETRTETLRPAQIEALTSNIEAQTGTERSRKENVEAQTATERKKPALFEQEFMANWRDIERQILQQKSSRDLLDLNEALRRGVNQGAFLGRKAEDILSPITNSAKAAGNIWNRRW